MIPTAASTPTKTPSRELRVLHLISMLHSGGPERWVVELCSMGRSRNMNMDIAVLQPMDGLFARQAAKAEIRVVHCEGKGNPRLHVASLRRIFREHGPYDAIHCHTHAYSGFGVLAAKLEGVPARVVHSHNVVRNDAMSFSRKAYIQVARVLIKSFATAGIAPASRALEDLVGPSWKNDSRWSVMPCGIDLSRFRKPIPESMTRALFGIPEDAFVMGSVGRLTSEKNSEFLVDVLGSVLKRRPNAYLLMVGEGDLRERLLEKSRAGGFPDRLILAGVRSDIPDVMRGIMDVFVFPSPPPPRGNEALPIAVSEAQAAGLPTVISDGVTSEAIILPDQVIQIPESAGVEKWAETVLLQAERASRSSAEDSLAVMERSNFNCVQNLEILERLYRR